MGSMVLNNQSSETEATLQAERDSGILPLAGRSHRIARLGRVRTESASVAELVRLDSPNAITVRLSRV
ncbi:hypothetical protein TorRG33x02_270270 [Trema orientale]|uniref:Uncharacterized protein n=1 Tax=Trema orientale TaxID=63057 RepID=A0A2P5CX93_TREOI|nr:hypothetical protein TorRG33x02_270270 [Trema orientale]